MSLLTSPILPSLTSAIGFLVLILELNMSFSVTIGYISALALFLAYNTFYKAVDMAALYALKYAEVLKIPFIVEGVIAAGSAMSAAARATIGRTINEVANAGLGMGEAIWKVLALPQDIACSLLFKRQCPQIARFVERLEESEGRTKEAEKMSLLEVGRNKVHEMV